MGTIRINDFAFVFRGGKPFNSPIIATSPASFTMDLTPYLDRKIMFNSARNFFIHENGAEEDLVSEVNALMNFISSNINDRFDTIGSCCIVGMSNGAALALGLASELSKKPLVPELTYVGITNVPMFPFGGRKPPIPNVGKMQPLNDPIRDADKIKCGQSGTCKPSDHFFPPDVKLDFDIKAKTKRNFYERAGNHTAFTKSAPTGSPIGWWWSSNMDNEVHGTLDFGTGKWSNEERFVNANEPSDLKKHQELCEGQGFKDMLDEASKAFAQFPI
jgi:hypothetical protein